jgi:CRISPR/Cas system-associated exonuclease Cas4 (RecB family)
MSDSPLGWQRRLNYDQSKLQDFTDCPRRFQLRHVMQQRWPAPPAEPLQDAERADRLGRLFHLIMERHWLGLPVNRDHLEPALQPWWDAFMAHPPRDLPGDIRRPEVHTSALLHDQRVVGMFDLLAYEPGGKAVIVDWKTTQRQPNREWLDRRMQTVIYPLLLVESSVRLLDYQIAPEDVRLIYWFANSPAEVEVFHYSTTRYESDKRTLKLVLDRLFALDTDTTWPLTTNEAMCRLCQYRSLCDRGRVAGRFDELVDEIASVYDQGETIGDEIAPDDFVL